MTVYTLKAGKWVEVEFEPDSFDDGAYESLAAHGYEQELGSGAVDSDLMCGGAHVHVNHTTGSHFIEVYGATGQRLFAAVADNPLHCMETLQAMQPWLALAAMEQRHGMYAMEQAKREMSNQAKVRR